MMGRQIERIHRARLIDRLVVATSADEPDDPIAKFCATDGVPCFRGSLHDVLSRFQGAARSFGPANHIVRLTADCPLIDWNVIDGAIQLHLDRQADYTGNVIERTYPDGLDVEVMTAGALERAAREASDTYEREHVTPYLYRHPELFTAAHLRQKDDLSKLRWTVDDSADFAMVSAVYRALYRLNPEFVQADILKLLTARPDISSINAPT